MRSLRVLAPLLVLIVPIVTAQGHDRDIPATCARLEKELSGKSAVFRPGSVEYDAGVKHWANSSSEIATCVIEAGSAEDIGKILKTVAVSRTPFAVKGGGHATNQGFSSTTGVQISMSRFNQIDYDAKSQSVVVGAGVIFDDVYAVLEPHNVSVVGARASGVGVAGFTLGGGYSYLSNMYGLASDNVLEYELVLPTGNVVQVDAVSHADLFFGLRGGFNNLGIVTKFTLKTPPLGPIWGGTVFISPEHAGDVFAATAKFQSKNRDPKAAMLLTINSIMMPAFGPAPIPLFGISLFYAASELALGIFDDFIGIPTLEVQGVGQALGPTTLEALVLASASNGASIAPRAVFNTYGFTDYSVDFLNAVLGEIIALGQKHLNDSMIYANFAIEPFLPTALSHSLTPALYPASRDQVYLPTNLYLSWTDSAADFTMQVVARESIERLKETAVALGQDLGKGDLYPNYGMTGFGIEVDAFWGKDNVKIMQTLRNIYDPAYVMTLAGGWRV